MTADPAPGPLHQLLSFGEVRRLRVRVGSRARPDGPVNHQYLLDLPIDDHALDEARVLETLEPVLSAGVDAPRPFSLHQHRWHASTVNTPGELEIDLLVTTGQMPPEARKATDESVVRAFRTLIELAGRPEPARLLRDDALRRARRTVATTFGVDPDSLWLGAEEHHPGEDSWTVGLRTNDGEQYDVHIGFVDGHPGSARVDHARPIEVSDSLGSE